MRCAGVGVGAGDLFTGQQGDVVVLLLCGAQFLEGGAPDQVVGYQPAQFAVLRELVVDDHGEGRGAVEYLGIAQRCERAGLVCRDALPQSQIAQDLRGMLGQRDFAPVIGRVFNGAQGLLLHHGDAQPVAGKRTCQAQARRAGAADQDVVVHGG
jgi:hypothetical protein